MPTHRFVLAACAVAIAAPAPASTPAAWAAMNRAANRACLSMVDLRQKKIVGEIASFSDTVPVELRIVEGINRRGVREVKLCAYDRAKRRAAVTDAAGRLGANRR